MSTLPDTTLSKPTGSARIPVGHFSYMRSRNRHRLYSLVIDEFKQSGLSQADLARRLGKAPEIICRLLSAPGNWQIDTVSDLLFAISGAEIAYSVGYPLDQAPRNYRHPEWLGEIRDSKRESMPRTGTSGTGLKIIEPTTSTA